ncbi:helix-turn-helix domain-containing protein [Streptomyces sp. NPDC101115]|uniref:helix-turn-helix domain-containing protein n=1 Tax=Streptomyces sp. NPDC101115 TaxID=3366106 RepID=UPI00381BA7D2
MRYRHRDRFTVVGHHLAQHTELSAVAIGLAVYIQSLPDGADVSVKRLALRFPEGEITIRRALNQLVAAGYLERRRVALGGGRFATRVISYDKPGCGGRAAPSAVPAPAPEADPEPEAEPGPDPEPRPEAAVGPAVDILARLRAVDPRLLLSRRDVRELAPAVDRWLDRAASPEQITRTLTATLPPGHVPIHHPARFLAYRLTALLPPPLPVTPRAPAPPPLVTCDGCDRAVRSDDPTARCADCRRAA